VEAKNIHEIIIRKKVSVAVEFCWSEENYVDFSVAANFEVKIQLLES
jgi:hypothetical protein